MDKEKIWKPFSPILNTFITNYYICYFIEYIYIYIMTGFHCEALDGLELSL